MWYRIIDKRSPFCGWDVAFTKQKFNGLREAKHLRLTFFPIGDRPMQIMGDDEGMGIWINEELSCVPSPIQEQVVEVATDNPYGRLEKHLVAAEDSATVNVMIFEKAVLVSLVESGCVTFRDSFFTTPVNREERIEHVIANFIGPKEFSVVYP